MLALLSAEAEAKNVSLPEQEKKILTNPYSPDIDLPHDLREKATTLLQHLYNVESVDEFNVIQRLRKFVCF